MAKTLLEPTPSAELHVPTRLKMVKVWAACGVLTLALIAYSLTRWLFGGHAQPTPIGGSDVPGWMTVAARLHEVAFVLLGFLCLWKFIIRPWMRSRDIGFDGMMWVALVTMWLAQDPATNYPQVFFVYPSVFTNLGCPQCFMPGWQSNAAAFTEPILFAWGFYFGLWAFVIIWFNSMMRWGERRWPKASRLKVFLFAAALSFLFDFVTEVLWIRLGLYVYAGAHQGWSLFGGRYYQLPMYEVVVAAVMYATIAGCRYFKNDRGETWGERGIGDLKRATTRQRAILRQLAVIGVFNVALFVTYSLPMAFFASHVDRWSEDVYSKSYYSQKICGDGTTYACPDPRVPIARSEDTARVTPEGKLIAPAGVPVQVNSAD